MTRPTMRVAGSDHYSDEELTELSREFRSRFDVSVQRYEEFEIGEIAPYLMVAILFVARGFLESMGKDIWRLLKEGIPRLIVRPNSKFSDLELRLGDSQRTLIFKCRSNDRKVFESALDKVEAITRSNALASGKHEYAFDPKKDGWSLVEEDRV